MVETWQDALDFLYGLTNWETRPPGSTPTFELERFRRLLVELGNPHQAWPAVHVGGTNGKGSTAAYIASALSESGYRTGLYTSPHLHTVRERIRVDGAILEETEVIGWLARHGETLRRVPGLTTFEALTAMAFRMFADGKVDVAVVEVGLGGRLDTTNVVDPVLSVLTPIGLDHTEVLGSSIAEIAADKAGILRPGVTAVVAPQHADAWSVIESSASRLGLPLLRSENHSRLGELTIVPDRQRFRVDVDLGRRTTGYEVETVLRGPHQRANAATAAVALTALSDRGWRLAASDVERGLGLARWPGRFEELAASPRLVVDGAHNPHAARALVEALDECYPGVPMRLIVGISGDKDARGLLEVIVPRAEAVIATRSEHPRAMEPGRLGALITEGAPGTDVAVVADAAVALDTALASASSDDLVLVTGSIFLVADAREAWAARGGMPMPPRDPPPRGDRR